LEFKQVDAIKEKLMTSLPLDMSDIGDPVKKLIYTELQANPSNFYSSVFSSIYLTFTPAPKNLSISLSSLLYLQPAPLHVPSTFQATGTSVLVHPFELPQVTPPVIFLDP
jgi:hypothetical protein